MRVLYQRVRNRRMNNKKGRRFLILPRRQKGDISVAIILVAVVLLVVIGTVRLSIPSADEIVTAVTQFCRPDPITSKTPSIDLPAYVADCPREADSDSCKSICILDGTQGARCGSQNARAIHTYKRIKTDVPIRDRWFTGLSCRPEVEDTWPAENPKYPKEECEVIAPDIKDVQHFSSAYGNSVTIDGKRYEVRYFNSEAEDSSVRYVGKNGKIVREGIKFWDLGIIALVHLKDGVPRNPLTGNREFVDIKGTDRSRPNDFDRFWVVDLYKDVSTGDKWTKKPLPDDILQCQDGLSAQTGQASNPTPSTIVYPTQKKSATKEQLQLEWFLFKNPTGKANPISWWTPECKPALYLYPEKETKVAVTLDPKGYLTYTDPLYPKAGWNVTAYPDGKIKSDGKTYPYLYYESKIRDDAFTKPREGFVVPYEKLHSLFEDILPKLGLTGSQITDFEVYWEKALPQKPYYFVGVMDKDTIDQVEPLQISPKPSTIIRVRLYFEGLSEPKLVPSPQIVTPKRAGFTVVEWGGMMKLDKNSNFTCSQ